ncbi:hypothetical protein ABPG74_019292, partial [Tetrahymena malaccensis]
DESDNYENLIGYIQGLENSSSISKLSLQICHIQIDNDRAQSLGLSFSRYANLTSLEFDFSYYSVDNETALGLGLAITKLPNLKTFNLILRYSKIDNKSILDLICSLKGCGNLSNLKLDLLQNNLFLYITMTYNYATNITSEITDLQISCLGLGNALKKVSNLQALDLSLKQSQKENKIIF